MCIRDRLKRRAWDDVMAQWFGCGPDDPALVLLIVAVLAAVAVANLVGVEADIGRRRRAAGGARPLAVRHQNPVHATGVGTKALAQTQGVQHAEGGIGDGGRAPVEGRCQLGVERLGIDQHRLQPALRRRQRKRRPRQSRCV